MINEKRAAEATPTDMGKGTNNQLIQQGIDYISAFGAELDRCSQLAESIPTNIGLFLIKSANQTIKEAALRPNPNALWLSLWYEGECCCLFADSNLGKSIYAVQIATQIAESQKVLYFDFELSDKQFQLRYTDAQGNLHQFPKNLYRVEINRDSLGAGDFEEAVITNLEEAARQTNAKVFIIDNITYLSIATEKGDAAGSLMMRLMHLKRKYDLSLLILAHTPKRALSNPITQNDLAGSKKLYNFFDSVFAIGKSAKDSNLRYIKQLKVRFGSYEYDADNVIVSTIEKVGSFLQFINIGYATEMEHLKEPSDKDVSDLSASIKKLASEGKSYRAIATELSISLGKVQRVLKK